MASTYKDNPLWGNRFDLALVNALLPYRLKIASKDQLGFVIQSATEVKFSVHHTYGSKYQEKSCTLLCTFEGETLTVTATTTPHSKNDMRSRNRKIVGNSTPWGAFILPKKDAAHG